MHFSPTPTKHTPPILQTWLQSPGSFMENLKHHGITDAGIQVLGQTWETAEPDECEALNIAFSSQTLIREVLIHSRSSVWMFARTVFPGTLINGRHPEFAELGNRSLGSILFKDPTVKRSDFTFTALAPNTPLHGKISQLTALPTVELFGRRSVFFVSHEPLLLTEIFLPAIETLGVLGV